MTPELNKLVVLDPQWLIDVFKAVITVKPFHHQERGFKDMWSKLEGDGILENKLLQHTWGQMVEERPTFESLLEIMQKFSLLCSWTSSDEPCNKKYLVPSMFRWHPPSADFLYCFLYKFSAAMAEKSRMCRDIVGDDRQQCYCLWRHLLAVLKFVIPGIEISRLRTD